jgi:hypothetical protein
MTDDKKRPTRRNVRSELDDLRDAARAGVPDVTEIKITNVAVDRPDNDDAGDGLSGADVTVHTRYDPDEGEWVDARDDGDSDAVRDA